MRTLKVGIVGCGQIAQIMHLPFLQELPQFEIAAVCDISPTLVEKIGELYHVANRYTDYQEIVKQPDIDIIVVCTFEHTDVVKAAISEGKHILVEKPLCFNPKDGREIIEAAKDNNVKIMVGYMKRYDPGYEYALRKFNEMEEPRIVRVHDFAGNFSLAETLYTLNKYNDVPQEVLQSGTERVQSDIQKALGEEYWKYSDVYSTLLMLSSHDISVMRGVLGNPNQVIYSDCVLNPSGNTLLSLIDFGNGRRGIFEMGVWANYSWWDENLTVYGKNDILTIDFINPYVKYAPTTVTLQKNENNIPVKQEVTASYEEAFRKEWLHFYQCIIEDIQPLTSAEEGLMDVELAVEMIRAIKE